MLDRPQEPFRDPAQYNLRVLVHQKDDTGHCRCCGQAHCPVRADAIGHLVDAGAWPLADS